jgi:hypothetical protein
LARLSLRALRTARLGRAKRFGLGLVELLGRAVKPGGCKGR